MKISWLIDPSIQKHAFLNFTVNLMMRHIIMHVHTNLVGGGGGGALEGGKCQMANKLNTSESG